MLSDIIACMRFTLPKLFLAITLAAIACAGLLRPTYAWMSATVTLTVLLFGFALLRSLACQGRDRAFNIAFAIAGGLFLLVVTSLQTRGLAKSLATNYPLTLLATARENIVGSPPQAYVAGATFPTPVRSMPTGPRAAPSTVATAVTTTNPNGTQTSYSYALPFTPSLESIIDVAYRDDTFSPVAAMFRIGNCVWSWLLALLAGWLAGRMYAKRQQDTITGPALRP